MNRLHGASETEAEKAFATITISLTLEGLMYRVRRRRTTQYG
jgi:hypothetical protein